MLRTGAMFAATLALSLCVGLLSHLGAQEARHIKSRHSVEATVERAERIAAYHGLRILGVVDYAKIGGEWLTAKEKFAPARLIVFIDDRGAVPRAISADRLLALELPLKILVWEDDDGGVWLSYRDLRAGGPSPSPQLLEKLNGLTEALGQEAAH